MRGPNVYSVAKRSVGRSMRSPHLVPVLDAHTEGAHLLPGHALAEGETLARRLSQPFAPPLPTTFAVWIARQVAEALDALDQAGWTHADVKPANIMVSPMGHATLLDLGLAHRPADEDHGLAGILVGTPWYMAPETLLSAVRPDIRSDIYSLGAVLYEMLAGRLPFSGCGRSRAASRRTAWRKRDRCASSCPRFPPRCHNWSTR